MNTIVLSTIIFDNPISWNNWFGLLVSIFPEFWSNLYPVPPDFLLSFAFICFSFAFIFAICFLLSFAKNRQSLLWLTDSLMPLCPGIMGSGLSFTEDTGWHRRSKTLATSTYCKSTNWTEAGSYRIPFSTAKSLESTSKRSLYRRDSARLFSLHSVCSV